MSSRISRSLPAISFTDGASLAFLPRPTTPLNTPRTPLHWVLYAADRSASSVCSVSAIFAALSARSDSSLATSALSASASAAGTTSAASARASAAFARSTAPDAMASNSASLTDASRCCATVASRTTSFSPRSSICASAATLASSSSALTSSSSSSSSAARVLAASSSSSAASSCEVSSVTSASADELTNLSPLLRFRIFVPPCKNSGVSAGEEAPPASLRPRSSASMDSSSVILAPSARSRSVAFSCAASTIPSAISMASSSSTTRSINALASA